MDPRRTILQVGRSHPHWIIVRFQEGKIGLCLGSSRNGKEKTVMQGDQLLTWRDWTEFSLQKMVISSRRGSRGRHTSMKKKKTITFAHYIETIFYLVPRVKTYSFLLPPPPICKSLREGKCASPLCTHSTCHSAWWAQYICRIVGSFTTQRHSKMSLHFEWMYDPKLTLTSISFINSLPTLASSDLYQ